MRPSREVPQPATVNIFGIGEGTTSSPDVVVIICMMMEAQSVANIAMLAVSNANMNTFHTTAAQALMSKNGDKKENPPSLLWACGHGHLFNSTGAPGHGGEDSLGRIL